MQGLRGESGGRLKVENRDKRGPFKPGRTFMLNVDAEIKIKVEHTQLDLQTNATPCIGDAPA